jgi:hypothetical protein
MEVMQAFARRLELKGGFEKALDVHKDALRKLRQDREQADETLGRKITGNMAKIVADSVPIVGPIFKEGAEQAVNILWNEFEYRHGRKDARRLEDPLRRLPINTIKYQ